MTMVRYLLISSAGIFCLFLAAWVLSWVIQKVWAWIDDSKPKKYNIVSRWVCKAIKLSPYVYPVYNGNYKEGMEIFGYAKKKEYDKTSVHSMKKGKDYVYTWRFMAMGGQYFGIAAIFSMFPFLGYATFKMYPVALFLVLIVMIAFISRYVRRLNKKLKSHMKDKKAHNNESD